MTTEIATADGGTKAVAKPSKSLKEYLDGPGIMAKLAEAAGAAMDPRALVRMTLMAASREPKLMKCTRESVLRALLDAAELGIAPGGLQGRGYLVPRANKKVSPPVLECHFDPGYRGLLDIARRSDEIKSIEAHVIYEGEVYELEYGTNSRLVHRPDLTLTGGKVVAAYAVAHFVKGGHQLVIVPRRDLDKVRKLAADGGPWSTWYDEMAKKTALRRLCKVLPYEPKLERAVNIADAADGYDGHDLVEGAIEAGGRANALNAKLDSSPALPEADDDGVIPESKPSVERQPGED